jgi:hypothetical protein
MRKFSTNQIMGIILIIAAAMPFIPVIKQVSEVGLLATFIIGLYLLIK